MEENSQSLGRFTAGVLVTVIILASVFGFFTVFMLNSKDLRDGDKQRRQEQKDSISFNIDKYYPS